MPRHIPLTLVVVVIAASGLLMASLRAGAAGEVRVFLPATSCPGCTGPTAQPSPTPEDANAFESRMIQLVNEARVAAGCPAATPHPILMSATREWSEYMRANNLGEHAPSDFYTSRGYPTNAVLENIAGGSDIPEYVFDGWMGSPLHRRNLLFCYMPDNPSYDPSVFYEVGVGYSNGYWTLAIADRAP
ncbi:MAG: CAP domain-containing protein [Chloroflexales bacterium]|nr:CAP domain-containing protein [Chloroflexales bacterium]